MGSGLDRDRAFDGRAARAGRGDDGHRHQPLFAELAERPDAVSVPSDLITLLEGKVQPDLRKGRYPDRKTAQRISEVVRAVARELDA